MFIFVRIFLASVYSLMLKILGLIYKHVYNRSKSSLAEENDSNFIENRSQLNDEVVSQNSTLLSAEGKESLNLQSCKNIDLDANEESSVLVSKSSKCQILSGLNVSGFLQEPKTVEFVVQEMFVGSNIQIIGSDNMGLIEQNSEENRKEFDQESESLPFYFKLLNPSVSTNEETRENLPEMEIIGEKGVYGEEEKEVGEEEEEEEEGEEKEEEQKISDFRVEDEDFAYEIELIPSSHSSNLAADQESADTNKDDDDDDDDDDGKSNIILKKIENNVDSKNWMSIFLDETDNTKSSYDLQNEDISTIIDLDFFQEVEVLDGDEFIESSDLERESEPSSCADANNNKYEDVDSDDDDDGDVVSQYQNLVQQMKMELKNCRIGGLPTISEESETPKMIEDLKPLRIDHKIGYKDVMEGIQCFYKSYAEKMRKFDILNYQTSQAISFLQLKESQVYRVGKKKGNLVLPKILGGKVRRVYADPMQKSMSEMQRDLEVVYVGQVCLSWEILWWLDARARELLEYDGEGRHSYNRAAEELQQFQVLVQRFMEDELFQGRRHDNYVRSRSVIRSLLQVPTIRDDCLKTNKEEREVTDKITLEMLVEIIAETMLIFQEFVFADKKAMPTANSALINKVDHLQQHGSSELLLDVISSLEKKWRRMKEQVRSQNCIVKKMKRNQERGLYREMVAAQVDLRLIWRVLNMSRLSGDQLVWCLKKLSNINFVGRKVRREACFLLFPC